jgi:HSP20 family protein
MSTRSLIRSTGMLPSVFDDFFRNDFFRNDYLEPGLWNRKLNIPAVNIEEKADEYRLFMAAPGMKKKDFKIDIEGNMLTISAQLEEKKEEKLDVYTKEEFNYSSFSRSFTLPDEVIKEKIEAVYEDGVLRLFLPKKEEAKKALVTKHVAVK